MNLHIKRNKFLLVNSIISDHLLTVYYRSVYFLLQGAAAGISGAH